ncbi:hypothetical protein KGG70_gp37 [Streptomyces phage Celia]|uniref:Helix-turn-helix DNA binding domain protein n=1 Tax=Streptomyces phage Celia TaxID=2590946 RepID=A0A516KRC8_9CAUD|nr:hypothetical protein KGG70_gp37 [Streptomyces phage Celia]QDP44247.1 hypothetical protein SEA_CELIA_44 [Streptomyces phage Celia]QFG10507.1 hypothetical protein SEA_URZA_44 [Streptomyces phage Urza]QJD50609.1 helix-turn-helix DNA-binding domain protein [Streptomyces phage Itza]USH45879.1 hypothetical protein SEA_VIEENROSE_44 [Streptomyces phage VieEnRose]
MTTLPGSPGPSLEAIWGALSEAERDALRPHLLGDTSADWLSAVLKKYGREVSASTIRTYRRALRQSGV